MTLPTHANGGIDRKKLMDFLEGLVMGAVDHDGELYDWSGLKRFIHQLLKHERSVRARERERCADLAEKFCPDGPDIAAAIRRMED